MNSYQFKTAMTDVEPVNVDKDTIIECYQKFTNVDSKEPAKMAEREELTYHELLKINEDLRKRLDILEEKIVGDGLEYLLED